MIDINEITSGSRNGQTLWICDLRYNDYHNKPIRHIKPTKVLVRSNNETKKKIYYSHSHFVALNKKDEPLKSKVFAPFDNTGYRMRTGTSLNCFETMDECDAHYRIQCRDAIDGLVDTKKAFAETVHNKIDDILSYYK
jgi:hypothetical protein